jgi:eukaryotic-like serine/threonine-protein kinase
MMENNRMARWQGHVLGRYRLLQMLGRGGMGEVWLAEDSELHRQVAVKLLPPVLSQEQDYLRTFAEEAHLVASLEHPNILPAHDFGEVLLGDDIITYLVMPVINGGSLRDRIKGSSDLLSTELSLKFLQQAASAIDYAHSRRVLHRDIKPGNMLLQDDWLYLADFGLAKLLSTSTYRSRTHAGAGTPEYMAPEQTRGKAVGASDLYSLTIIAYQLFTGQLPFRGDNPFAIMVQHIKDAVPPPRQFNSELSEEMERVILKGLSKQSQERYPSSQAFVDALINAWQNSPLAQKPLAFSSVEPGGKLDEPMTPPTSPRSTISTMVMSAGNLITPQVPSRSLETPQPPATGQQTMVTTPEKQKPARKVQRRTFLLGGVASTVLLAGGSMALASSWFEQVKRSDPQRLIAGVPILKLTGHIDTVWSALWNPQGRYLATGGDDTYVMLWDIEKHISATPSSKLKIVAQPDAHWQLPSPIGFNNLVWSPDGRKLATISDSGNHMQQAIRSTLQLIDVFAPDATPIADIDDQAAHAYDLYSYPTWSPRGSIIATVRWDSNNDKDSRSIALWPVDNKTQGISSIWKNSSTSRVPSVINPVEINALDWSCDGSQLAGLDETYTLLFWDVQTGKQSLFPLLERTVVLETDAGSGSYLPSLKGSPVDPTRFVVHNVDVAMLIDSRQKKVLRTLGGNIPAVNKTSDTDLTRSATPSQFTPCMGHLAWSPDGRYIASSYLNSNQIFIWDLANTHPKQTSAGIQLPDLTFGQNNPQSGVITYLDWSPDGRYIATTSTDGSVVVWLVDGTA